MGAKQPDAVVKSEDSSTVGQTKSTLDTKIALEEPELAKDKDTPATSRYTSGKHPNQIAALKKHNEEQRALGWPNLKKAQARAAEEQRALGWPSLKASNNLAHMKHMEDQRAAGFPNLKNAFEKLRASGYRGMRESSRAALLRDMEAVNKRKLAEDPTYEPPPLPEIHIEPQTPRRVGYLVCPRPGCRARCKDETNIKDHIRRIHDGGYSLETPYKCELASCASYFETPKIARRHFLRVHQAVKARCPLCDRELYKDKLKKHLRDLHGQT
jgi:hypothetical protein